jgi:hypothetical protein
MYWWVTLWFFLGIVAYVGTLYLVYQELHSPFSPESTVRESRE